MNALKKVLLSLSCLAVLVSTPACKRDKEDGRKHHVRRYKNGGHEKRHHGMHHEKGEHKQHHAKHKEKYKKESRMNGGKKSTKTMTEEESSY